MAIASTAFVQQEISALIDSAPSNLNTLNELAAAMNDNASFFSTVLPLSGGTMTGDLIISDGTRSLTYDVSAGELNHAGQTFYINKTNGVDVSICNDDLYVDASTSRIGIGTTTPAAQLDVTSASSPTLQLKDTTNNVTLKAYAQDANAHVATVSNHPLIFDVNNTEAFRIDTSGRLLIGTTSTTPAFGTGNGHAFHVSDMSHISRDDGTALAINRGGGHGTVLNLRSGGSSVGNFATSSTGIYVDTKFGIGASPSKLLTLSDDDCEVLLNRTGSYADTINLGMPTGVPTIVGGTDLAFGGAGTWTQHMIIKSNGNVGIGTTAPAFTNGNGLEIERSTTATLRIQRTGGDATEMFVNSGGFHIKELSHGTMSFSTANTERARFDSSGTFHIGATSISGTPKLHVSQATNDQWAGRVVHTGTGNTYGLSVDTSAGTANTVGAFAVYTPGGVTAMYINNLGKIGIGTGSNIGVSLDLGTKTDAIRVPNGTTGQRPTAATGQLRYNTTTSEFEGYSGSSWGAIGGGGDAFGTIAVSGQSNVVADQENDTLTLVGQNGITISTTAGSDTLTFSGTSSVNPFNTDLFTTSNNSTTAFVLSVTPSSEDNLIVFVEGVYQNKNSYTLSSSTLTLDSAPASGSEVVVHCIQNGVVGQNMTVDEFTGNGSATDFTLSLNPLSENNTFVYQDGVYQEKGTYSVSGTTLTFATAPTNGHSIEVVIPTTTSINVPADDSINSVDMFSGIQPSTITSTTVASTSATTIATHAAATYRTVKYLVQCTQGTDYHSTEINLIHDGSTVYITEYGTLFDNAALGTFSASISGGNILLQITAGSATSMGVKVISTAIPV